MGVGDTAPPRVVQTVASLGAVYGGPSRSVIRLCDGLARKGASVDVVTSHTEGEDVLPEVAGVRIARAPRPGWAGIVGRPTPFAAEVDAALRRGGAVVLHDQGMWRPPNQVAARSARAAGVPLVVSPKGMFSARALGEKAWKKTLAWHLYQRRALGAAAAFQVTSEAEGADVRRLGLRQPVAVIPHGVHVPPAAPPRPDGRGGERTALFLSRVHPIKGLPDLVEAWGRVRPEGWRLVVAGPDEDGHRAEVERQADALGLGGVVSFPGPVGDDDKWDLYRSADLFVLPTLSENFGIVVAEALAAGLPVLTTRAAPWEALVTERAGWWTETGPDALAAGLEDATAAPPDALRAMGERGRAYVDGHLSWALSAERHLALYRWLLGAGERPPFVEVD